MDISQYFINGDIKGAIAYMHEHEQFKDILPYYQALFEKEEYLKYPVSEKLNEILLQYQIYFRDVFYLNINEEKSAKKLLDSLFALVNADDEDDLIIKLATLFEEEGYHCQFGKTQGYYGPYIWKDTIPVSYHVELIDSSADYPVNILKGFIIKGYMDYLTFGQFGTRGWALPDGTINCIEEAYDFESDKFKISLLKHEAQHAVDMKLFKGIATSELEYRAKLVELHYTNDSNLLTSFILAASEDNPNDSHAIASYRIKKEFDSIDKNDISSIQKRALELFELSTREMKDRYN